jgi:hypothetical protein
VYKFPSLKSDSKESNSKFIFSIFCPPTILTVMPPLIM